MPTANAANSFAFRITQGSRKGPVKHRKDGDGDYREELVIGESDIYNARKSGAQSLVSETDSDSPKDGHIRRFWVGDNDDLPNLRLALRRGDDSQGRLVVENRTAGGSAVVEFPAGDLKEAKKLLHDALKKIHINPDKMDYDDPDARVSRVTLVEKNDRLSEIEIARSIPYPYLDYSSDPPLDRSNPSVQKHDFELMKYGFPSIEHPLFRNSEVISYNTQRKTANWVAERLDKYSGTGKASRSGVDFKVESDDDIAPEFKASLDDYRNSGFDRGHLAPAADHTRAQKNLEETFLLANISPQVGQGFNQHYWKELESKVRDWGSGDDEELYVITGPAFLSEGGAKDKRKVSYQVIGDDEVAVPTHFFKAMLEEKHTPDDKVEVRTQAFLVPNQDIDSDKPLDDYLVSVDDLEQKTGLDFFNRLPDKLENEMEAEKPKKIWADDNSGWHLLRKD